MVSIKSILLFAILLVSAQIFAQNVPIDTIVKAQIDTTKIIIDSLTKSRINALTAQDSAFGKKAKKIVPKKLYDLLFRDIYNRSAEGQVNKLERNPHLKHKGKWIHKIYIHNLDVFGYSVYDTTRKPRTWTEKTGNYLHTTTKESIIKRNFLFFEEGDIIDPEQIQDNERYLRQQGIFVDVRIVIVPYKLAKDGVDVHLFTQDTWSLIPSGSIAGLDNFMVGLEQRNFLGRSHSFKTALSYRGRDTLQKIETQTRYLIPSFGQSYISGEGILNNQREQKQLVFRVFRPFLTPNMKYAGAAEMGYHQMRLFELIKDPKTNRSVRHYYWSQYSLFDAWIGRSFKVFFGSEALRERARFVISARHTRQNFYFRDKEVTDSTNQLLQDIRPTMFSIGYSNRRYYRDLLIYGFGRTEDVPVGESIALIYGRDPAELGKRRYVGVKFSKSRYIRTGYWYGLFNIGTYLKQNKTEQGTFSTENNYFTPLHSLGRNWYARHFFNVRWTIGFNRFQNDFINISGIDGIQSPFSDELTGTKKLILGTESVFFSPINLLGFRIAPYTFANIGWAWFDNQKMIKTPLYQAYGIGFRLRNENLTFNTFQVKFTYFVGIPDLRNPFRMGGEGIPPLRFRDFDISRPEVVLFR